MTQCSRHISWLELELHFLGELSSERKDDVADHLGACSKCRASLAAVEADDVELLPLPHKLVTSKREPVEIFRPVWPLAAAAAVVLCVVGAVVGLKFWGSDGEARPNFPSGIKGGDVEVSLVANTEGGVVEGPTVFHDGDVIHVEVTTAESGVFSLFALQGGQVFVLIDEPVPVEVGNRRPLPGAHRVSGDDPITFCVTRRAARELSGMEPVEILSSQDVFCAETLFSAVH